MTAQANARGATHTFDGGVQAVARGADRCALHVHGRGARTNAYGPKMAIARIAPSQPKDAMARIASRRSRIFLLDPNLPGQNSERGSLDVDSKLFSKVQIDRKRIGR
jgi:hypothetical protein